MVSFNPIGCEGTTEYGNKYTKSNIGKSVGVAIGATFVTLAACKKPVKIFGESADKTIANLLKDLGHKGNLSNKAKYAINLVDAIIDLSFFFGIGAFVDKQINKKRAEKANLMPFNTQA